MSRVLVIDDDAMSRELLELLLESEGYEVSLAASGAEALLSVEEGGCPDVVLMDLQMPGISGAELVRRLRSACDLSMRLIAMSGSERRRAEAEEADGFLLKPFSMEQMAEVLRAEGGVLRDLAASEETEDATVEVLDERVFGNFQRMLDGAALRELYGACLDDAAAQWERMREALRNGDDEGLRKFAHALKGSVGMLGARELEAMCLALELHPVNATYVATLEQFPDAFGRLRVMLDAFGVTH